MWENLLKTLLSSLIPLGTLAQPVAQDLPPLDIQVEPLAKTVYEQPAPLDGIRARSALVIETHSNETLYQKDVWEVVPIASLTKLMTALIVREELDLDTIVEVTKESTDIGGSQMGLVPGERIQVRELLQGLLIPSGNDAAYALAIAASGTPDAFVSLMNERVKSLGLESTQFVDPAGLGEGNVSSAFELAHLAKQVFKDPFLLSVMKQESAELRDFDSKQLHVVKNTNKLLGTDLADRVIAGKTGTTPFAGQCLIAYMTNHSDRTTLTLVLGSPDRYSDIQKIIGWVDENYHWH